MDDEKLKRYVLAKRLLRRCRAFIGPQEATEEGGDLCLDIDLFFASEPSAFAEYMAKYPGGLREWEDLHGRQEP